MKHFLWRLILALTLLALLPGPLRAQEGEDDDETSTAARLESLDATVAVTGDPYLGSVLTISPFYTNHKTHLPAVAYNWKHNEYLVVWHTQWTGGSRDIRARRISAQGQLLSDELLIFENPTRDSGQPAVAYDPVNDRYLVVFAYDVSGIGNDWDIYGRFIPWNGPSPSLTAFPIVTWNTKQWNPRIAYARAQEEFLIVWWTDSSGGVPAYVSGRRIFANGSGFPAGAFAIASHATLNRVSPDVTYNLARNEYLVVWDAVNASRDIYGLRLTGSGGPMGGEFGIAGWTDNEISPSVAACNAADQYLVVWQSLTGPPTNYDIYGRFVKGDGTVDTVHLIDNTTGPEITPRVSCDMSNAPNISGQQYLIAYQQIWNYGIVFCIAQNNLSIKIYTVFRNQIY